MNVQSPLWRRALRRSRRWWAGQTRSRRIPLMAGGFGLLGAIACCCLALPAALSPNRGVADRPTLAATLVSGSDSDRVVGQVDARSTAVPVVSATVFVPPASPTTRPPTATRPATQTPAPTNTSDPTRTMTPTATLDPVAGDEQVGVVTRVIDGDTLEVAIADQTYRVRYIGIDTPEAGALCGDTATAVNAELVSGQTVRLVRDVSQTDRYDRLLRYVYVGDVFINAELIRRGVAEAKRYAPDTAQAATLEAVETQARAAATACYAQGVFGGAVAAAPTPVTRAEVLPVVPAVDTPLPVVDTPIPPPTVAPEVPTAEPPTAEPPTPAPAANCDPSYPDVCIPPAPPDLDCPQIPFRYFRVLAPDPHRFDGDHDGIGCESD